MSYIERKCTDGLQPPVPHLPRVLVTRLGSTSIERCLRCGNRVNVDLRTGKEYVSRVPLVGRLMA